MVDKLGQMQPHKNTKLEGHEQLHAIVSPN